MQSRLMMDEILRTNYPVPQWSRDMSALKHTQAQAEHQQNDKAAALMQENGHLKSGHVELEIEVKTTSWQPQDTPKDQRPANANPPAEPSTMNPVSARKKKGKTELQTETDAMTKAETKTKKNRVETDPDRGESAAEELERENTQATQNTIVETKQVNSGDTLVCTRHNCQWNPQDKTMLEQWAPLFYKTPTFFGLLTQIARLQINQIHEDENISTEKLLSLSTCEPADIKIEVFRHLKNAWDLGLLDRGGETGKNNGAGSTWTITADGRRYLQNGLRSRLKLLKLSKLTKEQICTQLNDDELHDREAELRERNRLIEQTQQSMAAHGQETPNSKPVKKRLASKYTGEQAAIKAVSRDELAKILHEQAISQVQNNAPQVGALWAGLIR